MCRGRPGIPSGPRPRCPAPWGTEAGPERALDEGRQRARLLAAVQGLPPADRSLVLLWLEGLSTRELSEATGLSVTNCTSRLSRLRERLVRDLETTP